ncbi:hypothetical protein ACO2Q3_13450 [Caulobacter sp. KR2-114]|uniref:hypothetical protein n=1 Tax=Caulobacter sp. KR2-114 TaxID=3400912 RepID=UPI003C098330
MGLVRIYSEQEVGKILKESEGVGLPNEGGQGHSEGLHEIVAVGRGRESTSVAGLEDRALTERKSTVGAFDGSQIKAVTFALNTQAGQNTLAFLNAKAVWYVFTKINVSGQGFKMKLTQVADMPKIGPATAPVTSDKIAQFVCMKLMANDGALHIRTAYPVWDQAPLPQPTCEIVYRGDGGKMNQELPV